MPDEQPTPVRGPLPRGHLLALNRSFRRTWLVERAIAGVADEFRNWLVSCRAGALASC
jgi:hypothetical protein